MKIEKRLWITLFVFGLFAICFSGWIFSQSTTREKLFWDNTIQCETKELAEGEIKSENIALPEDFDIPRSILFKTTHTIAEVWLDGEKIYEYGNEADAPGFMKTPGSCWHIVDIPGDSSGKNLEVRIIPVYEGYYGNKVSLVYGTRGDCILKILTDSLGTLVISCGILFAAVICLLLYCGAVRRKRRDKTEAKIEIFLNLGFFSLLVAVWTLVQCGFLQFLIPDGRTLYFVNYFSLFLFPVPFNFLLYDICKSRYHKGALIFSILYLANMAVDVLLQCTGIIDMFRLLSVTHVIMVANAVYTVVIILYEVRKSRKRCSQKIPVSYVRGHGICNGRNVSLLFKKISTDIHFAFYRNHAVYHYADLDPGFSILRSIYPEAKGDLSAENSQYGYAHRGHEPKCLRGYGEISG